MFDLLNEAEIYWGEEFVRDNSVDGGDLAEWFAEWLPKVRSVIATIPAQSEAAD